MRCEHYACRCARAAELAALAHRTGDGAHLLAAVAVHSELVECRLEWDRVVSLWGEYCRLLEVSRMRRP